MRTTPRLFALLTSALLITAVALPISAEQPPTKREPVERDLGHDHFVSGGTVAVDMPVAGDLIAAGGDVDVSAEVGGDAVVAGGNVRLGAGIKQGVYAAGGRVSIDGPVQRNVRVFGGTVEIGPRSKISGNVTIGGGNVRITGAIDGYLQVGGGHVVIDGPVGGNVEIGSGDIELGPNARITGKMRYASGDELKQDPAALVQGGIERFSPPGKWLHRSGASERAGSRVGWVWSIGVMLIAAILVAALPGVYTKVPASMRERWAFSLLIGFIALVCIPVAAVIAMFTIIGVPLALATLALYLALVLIGYVTTGISVGTLALSRFQSARASHTGWRVAAAALGMLAISLLARVPWVGTIVVFAAMLLGMGALLMQLAATRAAPKN